MRTSFEFGYHCGHFVASTICPQMRSHEALISRALCENKSACDGFESLRPMNVLLAVGEVLLHRHNAGPLVIGGPDRGQRSSQSESGESCHSKRLPEIASGAGHAATPLPISPAITVSRVTVPLRCSPARSKSIQPSLK